MNRIVKTYFALLVSIVAIIFAVYSILTGSMEIGRGHPPVLLRNDPGSFWMDVALILGFGCYMFFLFIKWLRGDDF